MSYIHSSVSGHFYILAIVNSAAMNVGCMDLLKISVFFFFGYILRSSIGRSFDSFIFRFLRNLHTVFHSGCTNLHSHQEKSSLSFTFSLTILVFLMMAIMTNVRYYLIVVLICMSLMLFFFFF